MIEWIVRAGLRNYKAVEQSKNRKLARFTNKTPVVAMYNVGQLLGTEGSEVKEEVNKKLDEKRKKHDEKLWQKYVRQEEQSAIGMKDACRIF